MTLNNRPGCRPTVLFHDADGCLNTPDGRPLAFRKDSLMPHDTKCLAELGRRIDDSPLDHLVLNTGRSWLATRFLADAIASKKLRYALVEHGAELWDIQTGQGIDLMTIARRINHLEAVAALASVEAIPKLLSWFKVGGHQALGHRLGYTGTMEAQLDKTKNLTFHLPDGIDGDTALRTLKELINSQSEHQQDQLVYHYSRWNRFVDVMGTMDKGIGLTLAMAHLGIDIERSAAIGDGLNDIPMLMAAALPICPQNAESKVKNLCEPSGTVSSSSYINATLDYLESLRNEQHHHDSESLL